MLDRMSRWKIYVLAMLPETMANYGIGVRGFKDVKMFFNNMVGNFATS